MANTFNNAAKITKAAMEVLDNNLTFSRGVNRQYKSEFRDTGAKGGDTINLRLPGSYGVRSGAAAQPQSYNDTYVPLTLSQFGVDLTFTTKELLLNVEDGEAFKTNVLAPMIAPLANYIDAAGIALYNQIPNAVGTPGTNPTDLTGYLQAQAVLDDYAAPRDGMRHAVISPWSNASMVKALSGLFHPGSEISRQYNEGTMGSAVGLEWSMDQNIKTHTTGTFAAASANSIKMDGTTAEGASQIVVNGWASGASALKKGDVLTIADVYAVNPVSKAATSQLKKFVVTEDISDTSGAMTIKISPSIYASGVNKNVDALPVNDAQVYVYGKADATYATKKSITDLVFHRDAFALVTVDLPKPESAVFATRVKSRKSDISMRMIQFYNGNTDQELYRLDVLFGWALARPGFACRVQG